MVNIQFLFSSSVEWFHHLTVGSKSEGVDDRDDGDVDRDDDGDDGDDSYGDNGDDNGCGDDDESDMFGFHLI